MGPPDTIIVPDAGGDLHIDDLAVAASSAAQLIGRNRVFVIYGTDDFMMSRGGSAVANPTTASMRFPGKVSHVLATGQVFTHVKFYNPTAAAIDIHVMRCSNS